MCDEVFRLKWNLTNQVVNVFRLLTVSEFSLQLILRGPSINLTVNNLFYSLY